MWRKVGKEKLATSLIQLLQWKIEGAYSYFFYGLWAYGMALIIYESIVVIVIVIIIMKIYVKVLALLISDIYLF